MNNFIYEFENLFALIKANQYIVLYAIGIIWLIQIINFILGYRLNILGIYPRKIPGLIGIVFAPFLHGSFNHLFFNTIPLYVLANFVLLGGIDKLYCVTCLVVLVSGFLVWCFSRSGIHVGASALIMGYFGFLATNAYYHANVMSILLIIVSLYYFGGLVSSLLPSLEKNVSWEGHIFGFGAGILATYIC